MKNKILVTIKLITIIVFIFVSSSKTIVMEAKVNNNSINNTIDLATMALKIDEFDYDSLYTAIDTFTGDLTGYIYNCPACGGRLACMSNYDITDGKTTYPDATYGDVRIVASSANLPCGSVIRFDNSRVSQDTVYAIVLDRGVRGNSIDLLSPSYDYATTLGRVSITYDVIRNGW